MSKKQRQSWNLLKPESFDVCKNIAALIIVMLDHLEIDMEISDAGMETMESNDCREMLRNNRDANSMLAAMQERTWFSCKDGQKFINPFIQSISRLC